MAEQDKIDHFDESEKRVSFSCCVYFGVPPPTPTLCGSLASRSGTSHAAPFYEIKCNEIC